MILFDEDKISGYAFMNLYDTAQHIKTVYPGKFRYDKFLKAIHNIEIFLVHCASEDASLAVLRDKFTCDIFGYLLSILIEFRQFGKFYRLNYNENLPYIFNGDELDIHMFIGSDKAKVLFDEYGQEFLNKYILEHI